MVVPLAVVAGVAVVHFQKRKRRQIGVGLAVELVMLVKVGQFDALFPHGRGQYNSQRQVEVKEYREETRHFRTLHN